MIASAIRFALTNFTLTLLVIGFIAGSISYWAKPAPRTRAQLIEAQFSYFLLFSIAVSYFYNFVAHVFFGEMSARLIGWAQSPFHAEVGFASLGFAAIGLMAFRGSIGLRAAAVIGPSFFLLGAAGGHIYQMITAHNFAPGNAGIIFWTDILVPIIGFTLLWLNLRASRSDESIRNALLNHFVIFHGDTPCSRANLLSSSPRFSPAPRSTSTLSSIPPVAISTMVPR